jgi:hypothetical protein
VLTKNLDDGVASAPIESGRRAALPPRAAAPSLSKLLGLRRLAGKLSRRAKKLAGKPDNSPWVLRPAGRAPQNTYVDFIFGLDYLSPNSSLVELFHEAMSPYGLSILLVNQSNVDRVIAEVQRGWLQPHVYLDLASTTHPRFNDLALAAAAKGVYVIDDPDGLTNWTYKATSHVRLARAGLPLPPTVILPKGSPDRELTAAERDTIGDRCVIKPSAGFGNRGVVVGMAPTAANIAQARDFNRDDDWLVQRMITWTRFPNPDRPAYLRAYNLLGHRSLMWWAKEGDTDRYDLLSWDDLRRFHLLPAVDLVDRVAALSGVDFFSSEIAITSADPADPDRFILIDYINDQCDMDPEARPGTTPVPEPWVRWVCQSLAEFCWRRKHGIAIPPEKTLTLF